GLATAASSAAWSWPERRRTRLQAHGNPDPKRRARRDWIHYVSFCSRGDTMRNRSWMWVLWPSFLVGAAASATVFALIDPLDVVFLGHIQASRQQVYAGGFFLFWL